MVNILPLWLALSAAQAVVPQYSPVLQKALAAAHADKDASLHDQFAARTVDDGIAGTPFTATLDFSDGGSRDGSDSSSYYSYDDGKLSLILVLDGISYRDPAAGNSVKFLVMRDHVADQHSYLASNAMGARARVSARTEIVDGLAVFDRPDGGWLPGSGDNSLIEKELPAADVRSLKTAYVLTLDLSGPAAKELVKDAQIAISGTIRPVHEGKVTGCYDHAIEPTFNDPVDVFTRYCWAGANISTITFRRRSTGKTLREWKTN